jgi:sugar transferase (PEP-CTERM/EpsH1 system associated)
MKVLIIDRLVPYPPDDGGKLRVFSLLRHISRCHDVALITLEKPEANDTSVATHLKTFCTHVEFVGVPNRSKAEYWLRMLRGVFKGEPTGYFASYSEEMADKIRTLTANEPFDIVDIQRPNMAPYIEAISPKSLCRKILTLYDVPYVQYRRIMSVERDWGVKRRTFYKDWLFSKRATLNYGRRFDKCILVSELDRVILKRDGPDLDITVVPNGVDTAGYTPLAEQPNASTLLMVGKMSYRPNVDAAIFFCREVFPLIKQKVPNAKLLIVGRDPTASVQALASEEVTVTGTVESVIPYYQRACISVVPLRSGGGTRLKILESMALGRPVVSTSLGCEGLSVTHDENVLIADTPVDFVFQTVRLLNDVELRQRLIANGRRLVEAKYDWQAIGQSLLQAYEEAINK